MQFQLMHADWEGEHVIQVFDTLDDAIDATDEMSVEFPAIDVRSVFIRESDTDTDYLPADGQPL